MIQAEKLRIRDNQTALDDTELTKRFLMLDARIHELEQLKVSWEEAVVEVQNHGLKRVNEVVDPFVVEAGQMVSDVRTEMEALQAEWAGLDMDGQLAAMDARLTAVESSLATVQAAIALQQATLDKFPSLAPGEAGKFLKVNPTGTRYEHDTVATDVQKTFLIQGALNTRDDLAHVLAGISGNISRIVARIRSGTGSATVRITNDGSAVGSVVADTTGASTTDLSNTSVTEVSFVGIDITGVSGSPVDVSVVVVITPGT